MRTMPLRGRAPGSYSRDHVGDPSAYHARVHREMPGLIPSTKDATVGSIDSGAVIQCTSSPVVAGAVIQCTSSPVVAGAVIQCTSRPVVVGAVIQCTSSPVVAGAVIPHSTGLGVHWILRL